MENPLLQAWQTPYQTPPFHLIRNEHFREAFEKSIRSAADEIMNIADNREQPDFDNTIAALDRTGSKLGDISSVFFNLNSAETNKELQILAQEISPLLTRFYNDITMNEKLFSRVKSVYEGRNIAGLSQDQLMLVEKNFRSFILGGAGLDETKKQRFRNISEELSRLSLKFEENLLEETNTFELNITDEADLSGLPDGVVEMAGMEARERNKKGWVFTLHSPSYIPFMQYADNRSLREKMFRAYGSRAYHGDQYDNKDLVSAIVNLRLEFGRILSFNNFADVILADRMADTTSKVDNFLEELHQAAHPAAQRDFENLENFAREEGFTGNLERWDWAYYSEKLKKVKYDIDDELLKPYFVLENVEKAIFNLATTLYGIKFSEIRNIPVYHNEVKTWEIFDNDESFIGLLYIDYFPRPGKNGGAWMTNFREQRIIEENDIRPIISIVSNFTRPTETKPSLLSFNELTTFLHEFGHCLHSLFSRCRYITLSGTNVARDFVELPSQFMENYAFEKEWLSSWAFHYMTGQRIPDTMIARIREASTYNEGYACNRQLGFGFLDMAWHKISDPFTGDITEFETKAMSKSELFPVVKGTSISTSFGHIFGGGYAAGYYGYKWAEVLDADAFSYFRESGIFNRSIADSFRKNILEKGGTDNPMTLYRNFRGKDPSIEALLKRSGFIH